MRIEEAMEKGPAKVMEDARKVAGNGPIYVSFDIDMLDSVYAPGTGTPEIGGFTTFQAQQVLRGLRGLDIVGADIVEVSPPFDASGLTAYAGVTMMFEIPARWRKTREAPEEVEDVQVRLVLLAILGGIGGVRGPHRHLWQDRRRRCQRRFRDAHTHRRNPRCDCRVVFATGEWQAPATVGARTWTFLVLSGLATGASWLCYYRARSSATRRA